MQAERPPVTSHLPAGVGQQDGPRRVSDRLADPLEDQQRRRRRPAPGQRQRGDRGHLDDVAEDGDGPELTGTIRQSTRDHAQAVAGQLAEAADDPDRRTGGAEQGEVRTGDAPRALVGEVGEEAHHPDEQDEPQGRRLPRRFGPHRLTSTAGVRTRVSAGGRPADIVTAGGCVDGHR